MAGQLIGISFTVSSDRKFGILTDNWLALQVIDYSSENLVMVNSNVKFCSLDKPADMDEVRRRRELYFTR